MNMIIYAAVSDHAAVEGQANRMRDLAEALGADTVFARDHHTSKSINLPVATLEWTRWGSERKLKMMIRDNFHDVNLLVMSNSVIDLPLDTFYEQHDFAWYQEQIARKQNYCFKDWTTEELEDPRILRVMRKNGNGWSTVDSDEKDRWTARTSSTKWYGNDWSSGELIPVGPTPFTEDTVFYCADRAYAEGIPEHAKPYTGPCSKFILSLDAWSDLIRVSQAIVDHVQSKYDADIKLNS